MNGDLTQAQVYESIYASEMYALLGATVEASDIDISSRIANRVAVQTTWNIFCKILKERKS